MERYSEYKDSGVKWLGEIPSHWELRKMKYTFDERSQKGFPNEPLLAATQNHGVILKSQYENRTVEAVKSLDTLKLVEIGDFVISLRSFQGGLEYAHNRGIISPAYTILTPTHIKTSYFKHLSKSDIFISLLKSSVTGIREGQNIDYNKLKECLLPIPPEEEQKAMGCYLDAATSKIDKAIAMQQKMIDLLNERKQIIIQNAVTKGLDDKVEMKDSGVEWTEFFPNSWSIKKVKYIFEFISTKEVASNRTFNIALENIVAHSGNYIDTNSEYEASGVSFRKNDILFGKLRPYLAKVHLCERAGIALGDIFVLRPLSGFDSSFLRYLLISEKFIQYVDSSTYGAKMPRANWDFIGNIYVAYPTLDKQRDISKYLDKQMLRFDSAISNCQRQISLLLERKQIIINEVVTGKVKVS